MTRSFTQVKSLGSLPRITSTACVFSNPSSLCAGSSSPTTVISITPGPSALTFNATFAAPPRRCSSRVTRTTGTGASGEIRSTSPNRYRSSIASPTTSTRALRSRALRFASLPGAPLFCSAHASPNASSTERAQHMADEDVRLLNPCRGLTRHHDRHVAEPPQRPTVPTQQSDHVYPPGGPASAARMTFGEFPDVEIASRQSPRPPSAMTCRENTSSKL